VATILEIEAALTANAGYAGAKSVPMAYAFQTAMRQKIAIVPKSAVHGGRGQGEAYEQNLEVLKAELDDVTSWISTNDITSTTGARVKYASIREYRT